MKKYTYKWEKKPTVAKSEKKGTCVTFVSCVLQRINYLDCGQALWHNGSGYGTGKVTGANDKMIIYYMNNKTLASLKNQLRPGDIVLLDDNKSGVSGSGGHIFILTGIWSGDNPYIWDNETASKGQKARLYSGNRKVLAIVRLKDSVNINKTTEQIAKEVINGIWGSGADRKINLEASGYNYDAVQKEVNKLLN